MRYGFNFVTDSLFRNGSDSGGEEDDRTERHAETESVTGIHASVMTGDPANVVSVAKERSLTYQERMYVLENSFKPHSRYKFPDRSISGTIRHFQHSWLDKYNGLVYSESTDGGYCKYCVLVGTFGLVDSRPVVLVSKPLVNFKKASEKLENHFNSQFHKFALESAMSFRANTTPIDQQLNTKRQQRIAENRSKLRSIVETVVFCGRQGDSLAWS